MSYEITLFCVKHWFADNGLQLFGPFNPFLIDPPHDFVFHDITRTKRLLVIRDSCLALRCSALGSLHLLSVVVLRLEPNHILLRAGLDVVAVTCITGWFYKLAYGLGLLSDCVFI